MTGQGSEEIRSLLATPIPEVLWHYTSLEALKNIVESKTIWASDIRFLNDSKEYKHSLELLKEEAERINDLDLQEFVLEEIYKLFSTGFLSPDTSLRFVASFSSAKDLLSQWRGYTEPNRGVSLGFDLRRLRPDERYEPSIVLAPCIYSEGQQRGLIRSTINVLLANAQSIREELEAKGLAIVEQHLPVDQFNETMDSAFEADALRVSNQLRQAARNAVVSLVPVMPLLKHYSFEEEQEWRLVVLSSPRKLTAATESKKTRVSRTSLIPYIEVDLQNAQQANGPKLTHLLMGPNPNMERSILAAKTFLEWHELASIKPEPSAASLRSW